MRSSDCTEHPEATVGMSMIVWRVDRSWRRSIRLSHSMHSGGLQQFSYRLPGRGVRAAWLFPHWYEGYSPSLHRACRAWPAREQASRI